MKIDIVGNKPISKQHPVAQYHDGQCTYGAKELAIKCDGGLMEKGRAVVDTGTHAEL